MNENIHAEGARVLHAASITIPDSAWHATSDRSALVASIEINGVPMHLEARAVRKSRGDRAQVAVEDADDFAQLYDVLGGGEPFQTARIRGRNYVLLASPYAD